MKIVCGCPDMRMKMLGVRTLPHRLTNRRKSMWTLGVDVMGVQDEAVACVEFSDEIV